MHQVPEREFSREEWPDFLQAVQHINDKLAVVKDISWRLELLVPKLEIVPMALDQ
jgi:hypothetical protein